MITNILNAYKYLNILILTITFSSYRNKLEVREQLNQSHEVSGTSEFLVMLLLLDLDWCGQKLGVKGILSIWMHWLLQTL